MQLEQDNSYGRDTMDAEDDSESEADEDDLDPLPPRAITFEIDVDVYITSRCRTHCVTWLRWIIRFNQLPHRHPLGLIAPRRRHQRNQIGIGRLWRRNWHYYNIINRFF